MHQNEMEIKGLHAVHEGSTQQARNAAEGVSQAMDQLNQPGSPNMRGPSQRELQKQEETNNKLETRRQEHTQLKQKAEAVAHEAKRSENEHQVLTDRLAAFQRDLQVKKDDMEAHDQRSSHECSLLREHCDQLRKALHNEQRDAVGVDQRAVLHPQCSAELESVKREMKALLEKTPRLAATLKARGQYIRSPRVEEAVDVKVQGLLKQLDASGAETAHIVWRLSPGEYLLGDSHVAIREDNRGDVKVQLPGGRTVSLEQALRS